MYKPQQLELFKKQSLNCTYELKRQIRLVLSETHLSRDQVVDLMNDLASRENLPGRKISKPTLDSWCKDSEPSRIPSPDELLVFCAVMKRISPLNALANPLGCEVIDIEDVKILKWAKAEIARKKAAKRARIAMEELE